MIKFILIFLLFVFISIRIAKKKGWQSPSGWLFYIYTLSLACALILLSVKPSSAYRSAMDSSYWFPLLSLSIFVLAFLVPFAIFDESAVKKIKLPSRRVLDTFSNIVIALSLYSMIFYSSAIRTIFSMDLGEARNSRYGAAGGEYFEVGLQNTIASVSASLYVFAIMLFFIYLILGKSRGRCTLLFLSSFSEAIHVLAFVGRDGIVFWIFTFVFEYFLFKDYLKHKVRRKIRRYMIVGLALVLTPFFLITFGRFSGNETLAIIDYMGQPFINGTLFMGLEDQPRNYGYGFPLIMEIMGEAHREKLSWSMGGTESMYFMTFVYGFILSLGIFGTILLCFFSDITFLSIFGKKKRMLPFYNLFMYLLFFQIYAEGVFYFRHYTRGGNLFIVISILFAITFKVIQEGSKSNFYIEKAAE